MMFNSTWTHIPETIGTALAGFAGREWVFRRLDAWLMTPKPRTFLITGEPGCGKSTLSARLVQISDGETSVVNSTWLKTNYLAYVHFCQALGNETSLDPLRFVESLSRQLAERYQPFALALPKGGDQEITITATQSIEKAESGAEVQNVVIEELHIGNRSPRVAFDQVVRRPLEQLCTANFTETILILIDALDEALTYDPNENIVTLLSHVTGNSNDLPPQVRFVLTSRRDPRITHLIGESSLDLITDAPNDIDDLREYTRQRLYMLSEPQRGELAKRVAKTGNGNFLYARYVLDDLIPEIDQNVDLSNLKLPENLLDIYRQFLKRELGKNLERWDERFGPLLGLLVTARGQGLKRSQLTGIMGRGSYEVGEMLLTCAQYLSGRHPDGPFHIYHQSFHDFLLTDSEYRVYPADANQAIARFFLEEYSDDWLHCQEDYALQYTPSHLMEAARTTDLRRLRQKLMDSLTTLLTNLDFLEIKTAKIDVESVLVDLRSALGLIPSENEQWPNILALLSVLDRESHHLRGWNREQHPIFFAQQLYNRATDLGFTRLATDLAALLEQMHHPFLKLLWRRGSTSPILERTFLGHDERMIAVTVTPDGQSILSGSADGTLEVWDFHTGQNVHVLGGHNEGVVAVPMTPDGQLALTGSRRGKLELWDLQTRRLVHTFTDLGENISALAMASDGRLALTGSDRGTLKLWNLPTGQLAHTFFHDENWWSELAMTADGRLALAISGSGSLTMWDLQTGQLVHTLASSSAKITVLAMTPDGRLALTGSRRGKLELWNLQTRQLVRTLADLGENISVLEMTPDGRLALTGSSDGTFRVWDLQTGQLAHTFFHDENWWSELAMTADGRLVLSGSSDGTLRVWDLQTGQLVHTLASSSAEISVLAMTPDGRLALTGSRRGKLELWNLQTRRLVRTLADLGERVYALAMTADGRLALSGSSNGTLRVWDLQTGQLTRIIEIHDRIMITVALSSNGRFALSSSSDGGLKVWDMQTGLMMRQIIGHEDEVTSLTITSDNRYAISGSEDQTLIVWDLQTRQPVCNIGVGSVVTAVLAIHSSLLTIYGTKDGYLRVFDLQRGEHTHYFTGHEGAVTALTATSDGRFVVSGSSDRTLRVWDLQTGQLTHILTGHEGAVTALTATSDGRFVVSGSSDRTLRVWDLQTGQPTQVQSKVGSVLSAATVTLDGSSVIAGFSDGILRVWNLETGQLVHTLTGHENVVYVVAVTRDGRFAISGSEDQTVRVWNLISGQQIHILGVWDDDPEQPKHIYKAQNWKAKRGNYVQRLPKYESKWRALAITPDGDLAISSFRDGSLRMWDLLAGRLIGNLTGHEDSVRALAITPDGGTAISGSEDKTVRVWDLQSRRSKRILIGHEDPIISVATTPDGGTVISRSSDNAAKQTIRVWDLLAGQTIYALKGSWDTLPTNIVLTPDGRQAIASSKEGILRMWNLLTRKTIHTLFGHQQAVSTIVLTPNGLYAISGSVDHSLRVWDVQSGEEVAFILLEAELVYARLAPDGVTILVGDAIDNTYCLRFVTDDTS